LTSATSSSLRSPASFEASSITTRSNSCPRANTELRPQWRHHPTRLQSIALGRPAFRVFSNTKTIPPFVHLINYQAHFGIC
jgi:hypothetical protein